MSICNCSFIIGKQPFNEWMAAANVANLTQYPWKSGWIQRPCEKKTNNLNKKMVQVFPELKTVICWKKTTA